MSGSNNFAVLRFNQFPGNKDLGEITVNLNWSIEELVDHLSKSFARPVKGVFANAKQLSNVSDLSRAGSWSFPPSIMFA